MLNFQKYRWIENKFILIIIFVIEIKLIYNDIRIKKYISKLYNLFLRWLIRAKINKIKYKMGLYIKKYRLSK